MATSDALFANWEEHIICHERGKRVVNFYLKDAHGKSFLTVIGTERSLRHMFYIVAESFVQEFGPQTSVDAYTKWRARRDVVDWLTSLVSKPRPQPQPHLNLQIDDSKYDSTSPKESISKARAYKSSLSDQMATRRLRVRHSEIQWSGRSWVSKQFTHYPALQRNGSIITAHSFVYILADRQENYVGYLEDMYEDKKGQKKVKVRWFHQEAKGAVSQLNLHPRELLITDHTQVISPDCVDGTATVLTRNHYKKWADLDTSLHGVHMCFRQLKNNKAKPFSLLTLRGYSNQAILSSMQKPPFSNLNLKENILSKDDGEELACGDQRAKRVRSGDTLVELSSACHGTSMKFEPADPKLGFKLSRKRHETKLVIPETQRKFSFKVDDKIELLCQDSGIRGCWFKCIILQVSMKHLKVQYEDVMDAETNDNLEEYVPAFRTAAPDKLNTRSDGRPRIRPRPNDSFNCVLEVGTAVDAWGGEGWWEGVVAATGISQDYSLQIYLPGENKLLPSEKKNIRISRDWDGDKWVDIKAKPDILSYLSSNSFDPTSLTLCFAKTNGITSVDHEVLKISKHKALKVDELKSLVTCASHGLENMKVADTEKLQVNEKGSSGDDECADNLQKSFKC